MTNIGAYMKQVRLVDGLYHSIMNDIMTWPLFLAFVTIDNDEEVKDEEGDAKYNE
jgi:hypothetical protein